MPIPIGDLIRMPKGTRELYPLEPGASTTHFQRIASSYARKAGVMKFSSVLIVNSKDLTVQPAVWIEVLEPLEDKKPAGAWTYMQRMTAASSPTKETQQTT